MTSIGRETNLTATERPQYEDAIILRGPATDLTPEVVVCTCGLHRSARRWAAAVAIVACLAAWAATSTVVVVVGHALSINRYVLGGAWLLTSGVELVIASRWAAESRRKVATSGK
jgi:hypothetical protein